MSPPTNRKRAARSEFGQGLVVPIAKFSEHVANFQAYTVWLVRAWSQATDRDAYRERLVGALGGEVFSQLTRPVGWAVHAIDAGRGDERKALAMAIGHWASGAADHLQDLDPQAPDEARRLAEHVEQLIGYAYEPVPDDPWADWERVRELWREACLALDRRLGVETDWGRW